MAVVPRVVIIGGGFGGLQCARKLRDEPVEVVLVDRQNYHLFTPLLYQVASCLLNPSEIAAPLRKVFRGVHNVRFHMASVERIDYDARRVHLDDGSSVTYDYVVVAAGSRTNYFGNEALAEYSLGLKDLGEALQLRNHVLECLERAASAERDERARLLSFYIVGGGPTGVEYAGALAELVRLVLPLEYPDIPPSSVRIVLLEGGDRLLPVFVPRLSEYARRELQRRGVEVQTNRFVHDVAELDGGTLIWTAGVRPAELSGGQRIEVDEHFRIKGTVGAYAVGDLARGRDRKGRDLPMTSPPAMQAGRHVARHILSEIGRGRVRPFRYRDKGTLATIGRRAAVGQIGRLRFTGFVGWVVWLFVHLYYLIGFENRVQVMLRWSWYYLRYDRPVRSVIRAHPPRTPKSGMRAGESVLDTD
jgi:NADH dehydrogenase